MRFALSEDQILLQQSVNGVLGQVASLDQVRLMAERNEDALQTCAQALSDLGLASMLGREESGGLGMGMLEAALVEEALGASVTPSRFLSHSMVVQGLQAGSGLPAGEALLQSMLADETKVALAIMEQTGRRDTQGVVFEDGKLTGDALFVLDVEGADTLIIADQTGAFFSVPMVQTGVTVSPLSTIDRTRDVSKVELKAVDAEQLTGPDNVCGSVMIRTGRILLAADTLGAAQAMLDRAVDYAKERQQFGRTIGSFQAVKHMCAEMAAKLEPARALVWHAAHMVDVGDEEADVAVCLAKAHLSEVGTFIARTSTEVHGGMGFTDLLGLHYWFKRIGMNRQLLGGPAMVREEAARLQGWV